MTVIVIMCHKVVVIRKTTTLYHIVQLILNLFVLRRFEGPLRVYHVSGWYLKGEGRNRLTTWYLVCWDQWSNCFDNVLMVLCNILASFGVVLSLVSCLF